MKIWFEEELELDFDFDYKDIANKVFMTTLEEEGFTKECEISLILTDDESIRQINKESRDIDKSTDVLSFPMLEFVIPAREYIEDEFSKSYETGELILGDVVISVPTLERQAIEYGHSKLREFAFLLTHSILHLLGYDHIDDEDRHIMEQKQNNVLDRLDIKRK